MDKKALFVVGGWQGHEPKETSTIFVNLLQQQGYTTEVSHTLDVFLNAEKLTSLDLIVPTWTMGEITQDQVNGLLTAVETGVGVAGWHGGMGDAFRNSPDYQFMVGGQWVAHPGNIIDYSVNIAVKDHPITQGIEDFHVKSEQYYMHTDPSNEVLATTTFNADHLPWIDGTVMPVVWTRHWGKARIFYCSLGHVAADFDTAEAKEIVRRGMLWASNSL